MSSESTPPVAAIILCAGKGTRMGAVARNKVCTPCAGIPVVRRILANLRAGGVTRFVVVTGYRAESVMRALDGELDTPKLPPSARSAATASAASAFGRSEITMCPRYAPSRATCTVVPA